MIYFLFFSSVIIDSQSSTLLPSGSMIHAKFSVLVRFRPRYDLDAVLL
jgi:hypothetical protein